MAGSRRLARNTLTLLTGNAGSAALAFLLSILIGRALGTAGIGAYGVVMAWVFPIRLLAEFGVGTLLTRDVAADVRAGPDLLAATLPLRLLLGGGLAGLLWLAAPLLSHDPAVLAGLRISAPLVCIEPFFGAYTAIFRAERVMWPVAVLSLGMLAVQVILTALILVGGGGVRAALAINTLTSAGQLGRGLAALPLALPAAAPGPQSGRPPAAAPGVAFRAGGRPGDAPGARRDDPAGPTGRHSPGRNLHRRPALRRGRPDDPQRPVWRAAARPGAQRGAARPRRIAPCAGRWAGCWSTGLGWGARAGCWPRSCST